MSVDSPAQTPSPPCEVDDASVADALVSHHLYGVLRTSPTIADYKVDELLTLLKDAVHDAGLTAVGELGVTLTPYGTSVVVLLTESHVALHHWPENAKITVDIHVCDFHRDNLDRARAVAEHLERHFALPGLSTTWHCDTISG